MSSSNRTPFTSSTVLNQQLLDACHDNLQCRLEMICEIQSPDGVIYASDRNKYVGNTFYEALLRFPTIGRTVGEWLSSDLQFSTLTLELSNVDGRFNKYLPSGLLYSGWVGKGITVKIGLAESATTYTTIFKGYVTDVGGFKRSTKSITLIARDSYDSINVNFPSDVFSTAAFPKIDLDKVNTIIPIIYGDWTVATDPNPAAIPANIVNGIDPAVLVQDMAVTFSNNLVIATRHGFDSNDKISFKSTTNGITPDTTYLVDQVGTDQFSIKDSSGTPVAFGNSSTGNATVKIDDTQARRDVQCLISTTNLLSIDLNHVYVQRGDLFYNIPYSEVHNTDTAKNNFITITQNNQNNKWFFDNDGVQAVYTYASGDLFFVRVVGKDLGQYTSNIVSQAQDILMTYGTVPLSEFDASWQIFKDKSFPVMSNVTRIKSRIWINEQKQALQYALSLLEQVRLEAFIDRDLNLKINSLQFEDWIAFPPYIVRNWDVEKESFKLSTDDRNTFNRAQAFYNFCPDRNENTLATSIYRNQAAVLQMGKEISKMVEFPNLYIEDDVTYQLIEIIKLASSGLEIAEANLTWRSLLKDVGDFVSIDVQIGSTIFDNVPAMIRDLGYDPEGFKIPVKVWVMSMVPFPQYVPGYVGTVGGYNASIAAET